MSDEELNEVFNNISLIMGDAFTFICAREFARTIIDKNGANADPFIKMIQQFNNLCTLSQKK